jgi:hypothetical protein
MIGRLWSLVSFPLVIVVFVTIISATLLGIGTLLTFLFAVSVWEATTIVTAVTFAMYWAIYGLGPHYLDEPLPGELVEEDEEPRIVITDIPFRPSRSRRRRRK